MYNMEKDYQDAWGSRKIFLAAMLSQTLGTNTIVFLPHQGLMFGAMGHILLYSAIYIFIGIPLLYMEYVTGQFTGRNCLEVWRARPCLSHVAYIQIFWQIMNVIISHLFCSFVLHYFLISFEDPIPYYTCGPWSNKYCNMLYYNYTIHQDCMTIKARMPYCSNLTHAFPEYQYWRYYILGIEKTEFYLAWRVTLASGLISIFLFISCFSATQAYKWMIVFFAGFLIGARILFLIGSMLQKGVVVKFQDALDTDFSVFLEYLEFPACTVEVLFSLNAGSGIGFTLASKSSFRSPCYSNTVMVVVISAGITVLGICTNALMLSPYCFKHGVHPSDIAKYPMFIAYETIPRLLFAYEHKSVWLILSYSLITISFLSMNTIIISSLIEVMVKEYTKLAKYPVFVTLCIVTCLYIFTIPLLGNRSFYFMVDIQRGINFLLMFSVMVECIVFLLCYGLEKFCEDVHFMLGVKPQGFVKLFWIVSIFVFAYVFWLELYAVYSAKKNSLGTEVGWWIFITIVMSTILVAVVKILIAMYKKKLHEQIGLDPSWGPKCDILKRSRAMFTTHAMTKEYIYRQYHLQAGILMRQKTCNIRA